MVPRLKALTSLVLATFILGTIGCARHEEITDPATLIASAWTDYSLGEFDRAMMKFESALAAAPAGGNEALQATYGLATTWNLRRPGEDPGKAKKLYQQILDAAPKHDLAAWSLLALARMKHLVPIGEDPDYVNVREAYQDVMNRYPEHLAAKEAFIYYNATLVSSLRTNEALQALALLDPFVRNPANMFVGCAYSLMAVAYTTLGNAEKRLESEILALTNTEVDPTNPFTEFSWQYWNIATIAEFEVGDFATARSYYNKLITEYPNDIRKFAAQTALKRMDELEAGIREGM
jgi:tetratricopeptide (TPR) repeat protein